MATGAGEIWEALADNIVTVTPGWSEAYGLFLEGEADMVLSYTTSPAYHLIAEEDPTQGRRRLRRGALHADRGRGHAGRHRPAGAGARSSSSFMLTEGSSR
jgi:ABC-type thiamine transport system substrate-binding protein